MISFFVDASPIPQPRQRHAFVNGNMRNYIPHDSPVHLFKDVVRVRAKAACPTVLNGPVSVALTFLMPRPASMRWKKKPMPRCWHTGKPDVDNLAKAVFDACNGIVWRDDSAIVRCILDKLYADGAERPGVLVEITRLVESTQILKGQS